MKQTLIFATLLLLGAGCASVTPSQNTDEPTTDIEVTTFETCVAAGNAIMKSNPPKCEHNGTIYTLELDASTTEPKTQVRNFDECVAAGNPVMESYPRQCRDGDNLFVEDIFEPIQEDVADEPVITPPVVQTPAGIDIVGAKTDTGISVVWEVDGVDTSQGFKVVYAKTAGPTYGEDTSIYISDAATRSYELSLYDGMQYYIRVCTYTGDGCTNYSNEIVVTAPQKDSYEDKKEQPAETKKDVSVSSIQLFAGANNTVSWVTEGEATQGYKVVYATTPGPTYPGRDTQDSWIFLAGSETAVEIPSEEIAGPVTYYVRVCAYDAGACTTYSNEVTLGVELQ